MQINYMLLFLKKKKKKGQISGRH